MKRIRVAAIDDVSDILDLIQYNLQKEGMDVEVYSDSNEALTEITKNPPDIVISDWMMPAPDGLEVCRRLKSNTFTQNIPVIMLTCKSNVSDYKDALAAGAKDFVVKPVRMEELIRRIKLLAPEPANRFKFG